MCDCKFKPLVPFYDTPKLKQEWYDYQQKLKESEPEHNVEDVLFKLVESINIHNQGYVYEDGVIVTPIKLQDMLPSSVYEWLESWYEFQKESK